MYKVVSFIVVCASLIWSWTLFNSDSKINTQIHAEIQSKLAILIEETIKSKKPHSSSFELNKMYTSAINENLISAHFSYKFKDKLDSSDEAAAEDVEQNISGYALLEKTPSENQEVQKWVIQSIKTNTETVSFTDGLVVTATPDSATENTEAPAEQK